MLNCTPNVKHPKQNKNKLNKICFCMLIKIIVGRFLSSQSRKNITKHKSIQRKQLKKKWSKRSPERVKKDYTKTKNDFYRMELDKLNEMRPTYNRPSMVNTYNAYLKNTPGSKQALDDCISGIQASLLKDQANVSLLPKQPRPSLKKSHSTLTSRTSTRQKVIKVVETPKVEVPRSSLQSRQTIESAG